MSPGIFICYRKNDSPGQALRVYRLVSTAFGDERVSMDVTIPPSADFVQWIEQRVGTAGVMVPIIGRTWLETDAQGRLRIQDDRDYVRNEIAAALKRGIAVLPVLVDGAEMPSEDALPADLAQLPRRQAHHLRSDADWQSSESRLVETLAGILGEAVPGHAPQGPAPPGPPPARRWPGLVATGLVGVALLVVGLVLLWHEYVDPGFRFLPDGVPAGLFTALASVGVLAGACVALALVSRETATTWLRVGLLAGFAVEAGVKGLSLLDHPSSRVQTGGLLWLVGGATLAITAGIAANHLSRHAPEASDQPLHGPTAVVALIGATMIVVGALIPFNIAEDEDRIVADLGWLAVDPIATAIAVVVAVGLLLARRRSLAAGLLIALGICSALLWVRYVGIPVAQWSTNENKASPQAGGFVALGGSVLVFCAGWRLAVVRGGVPTATPLPTS